MAKKAPAKKPDKQQWMTMAEAREADQARHDEGVLVELGPRFAELGIVKLRMVAHDGDEMKAVIRLARKGAVDRYNEGKPPGERIWKWEDLPPEGHGEMETEIAVASLRGGPGLELHGDFEMPEDASAAEVQTLFGTVLEEAPDWLVSGLYLTGSKILNNPKTVNDRAILETRKKGSACGVARALDSIGGGATATLASIGDLTSRLAALANFASASPNTTPQPQEPKTSKPSRSTA